MKYTFKNVMILGLGCLLGIYLFARDSWLNTDSTQTAGGDVISLQRIMQNLLSTVFAGQWFSNMPIMDKTSTAKVL